MTTEVRPTYEQLQAQIDALSQELADAHAQQTATGDVLRIIAGNPSDLQAVLGSIADQVVRLCNAGGVAEVLYPRTDGRFDRIAAYAYPADFTVPEAERPPRFQTGTAERLMPEFMGPAAMLERRTLQVADAQAPEVEALYPGNARNSRLYGVHTIAAVPLLRRREAVGDIYAVRQEVRPFTAQELALLETFADQAVIAIENTRLFQELQERNGDLTDALEQQTATAEVLRVIASSPADLDVVLNTIAESAARLCDAGDAAIRRVDGDFLRSVAHYGSLPLPDEATPLNRETVVGRAAVDGVTVHIEDLTQLSDDDFPLVRDLQRRTGIRTMMATPLLRDGVAIGVIAVRRADKRPFVGQQIRLLESFADQAVIAIENARLFQELEERNRVLAETLGQQTATAEVLRVIAGSPTDLQEVLDTIAKASLHLCDAEDVQLFRIAGAERVLAVHIGPHRSVPVGQTWPIVPETPSGRAVLERRTIHIRDVGTDERFEPFRRLGAGDVRTFLSVPMFGHERALGVILLRRREPRPFTEREIALAETFADQAVIAIENARLFAEVQQQLQRQTVTAEVLRVISQSPTDLRLVLTTISTAAQRLCEADVADVLRLTDGMFAPWVARDTSDDSDTRAALQRHPGAPAGSSVSGVAIRERRTVHVPDLAQAQAEFPYSYGNMYVRQGIRTVAAAPLYSRGLPGAAEAIGVIWVQRSIQRPFTDQQIALLETFADQAAIAIENARLFQDLQDRTRDLARSVDELMALAEVTHAVSSTLDLNEVLTRIVAHAERLSGATGGALFEYDETTGEFDLRVTRHLPDSLVTMLRTRRLRMGDGVTGQAAAARAPVQVPDTLAEGAYEGWLRETLIDAGYRALLAVPLLREERVLGGLVLNRSVPGEFAPQVVVLMQTFASQSALAIQNARLFREIEEKSRQVEEASRHKSQFLANMSHELRTPLNAILGYTELIVDGIYGEVPEKLLEVLERVQQSGQHLLGLINAVLDLSKIEAGQLVLSLQDYSLQEVAHTVLTAVESLAAEKGLALRAEIAPDLPPGRGDERRLNQVLLNLLGNAIKFTDQGTVTLTARCEREAAGDIFLVSVADTGPGIPEGDQERIFEEFQQADGSDTRKKGGTGLGLSIAKRIVELHGGRIRVESAVSEGSTFTFAVPVCAPATSVRDGGGEGGG